MAPLVLDKEETVDDDEDHGESDDDHHQEAAVQLSHPHPALELNFQFRVW